MKMHHFYLIGFICFTVVASMGIINYINDFSILRATDKIGTAFNLFFYSVLCYFFFNEYRKNKSFNDIPDNTQEVLEELKHKR